MTSISPSWARVGVKVQCITEGPWEWDIGTTWLTGAFFRNVNDPVKGHVYTVSYVGHLNGSVYLKLKEIIRHEYRIDGFRPLVARTQEQDVSAICKLVDELPILERAMLYEEVLNDVWDAR